MSKIVGTSLKRLKTVDPRLQLVIHEASDIMDMSVLCGVRDKAAQDEAYRTGTSKLKWPQSKHNLKEGQAYSNAVDVIPYFVNQEKGSNYDWKDYLAFAKLAGVITAIAAKHKIRIRWGGDWDQDNRSQDEVFLDLPHIELIE